MLPLLHFVGKRFSFFDADPILLGGGLTEMEDIAMGHAHIRQKLGLSVTSVILASLQGVASGDQIAANLIN